ncbi:MAG: hypothetical protein A2600_02980 [Candidatus Lambdaproteobacteria bacterium RIFOXYD1_FULL_56_27]|uniref:HD domain-containing protein n=1 Tax=Candidatus Lambdaproteobacteria bacterium RIFOXYD2_FULL_56_26 TaxID=1817773 RepID=A0A1F6H322_9PROT|nr:MAG: hypothetical protein A2557_07045 [Candidatus Lambdaproteobacteria bacterium RIFOXYD2_FULL_56_26]OGH05359.1 MAG: hypothetical protein A2426_05370 [Candidatus Lambdaproteobacteria bacterium RIFOXYC1_FULL_56_13]OGH09201.1 MAG: hypothetical protein A2600_02980 [Candidatus Lambdaproteobacteria bacterium RIFOXYD1_FULL_56_27]
MVREKSHFIRCPIHGSMPFGSREMVLVDSPYFQRLRQISQLGFASLVFPGATHTRFSHSLGVAHLAGRVFDQLCLGQGFDLNEVYDPQQLAYFRQLLRFAALLHDVGHPPFSHAGEPILPPVGTLGLPEALVDDPNRGATHEDYTCAVILRLAQEGLLDPEEAQDLVAILSKTGRVGKKLLAKEGGPLIYPLLCQLINGEIDVDRMDYLLRDAYHAGVPYGKFDLDRLVSALSVVRYRDWLLLALKQEDVATYENFLLSRVHMFHQIYFHKTLGAFSHYLKKSFEQGELELKVQGGVDWFLEFTESSLRHALMLAKHQPWAGRLYRRERAKTLIRRQDDSPAGLAQVTEVQGYLEQEGIPCFVSRSSNRYSAQIRGREIGPATLMVVVKEFGRNRLLPLAECSVLLAGTEEKQILITQLYVQQEDHARALAVIQGRMQ